MRSVVCSAVGNLVDLTVVDAADPECPAGRIVVEVEAAGVNFVDALFVRGTYQIKPPVPFSPGSEIAGRVSVVGDGVDGWSVGDRVMANIGLGGYASHVVVAPEQVVGVPDSVDAQRAATLGQSYCTAWFALARRAPLTDGETLLVLGAGGGVGAAAIDVGRHLGATVLAAASTSDKRELALAMGAHHVIDSSTEDVKARAKELSGGGVDVVIDPVGGDVAVSTLRALGFDGRFVVVGFASGAIPELPANQILLRNRRVVGVDWGFWALEHPAENAEMLAELLKLIDSGELSPPAPGTAPLADAAQVLSDLETRKVTGKVALIP